MRCLLFVFALIAVGCGDVEVHGRIGGGTTDDPKVEAAVRQACDVTLIVDLRDEAPGGVWLVVRYPAEVGRFELRGHQPRCEVSGAGLSLVVSDSTDPMNPNVRYLSATVDDQAELSTSDLEIECRLFTEETPTVDSLSDVSAMRTAGGNRRDRDAMLPASVRISSCRLLEPEEIEELQSPGSR